MEARGVFRRIRSDNCFSYLVLFSVALAVAIASVQIYREEWDLNPVRVLLLMPVSLAVFFLIRRRCDRSAFNLSLLGTMFLIVAYMAWPTRYSWPLWHDQSYTLRMTIELAQGYLSGQYFLTGVGYPILAAPFYGLFGNDALFVPNLFLFAGTVYFSFLTFRKLTNETVANIAVLFLIFATTFSAYYIVWWNHGILLFSLMLVAYLSMGSLRTRDLLATGFVMGYSFFSRYVEVIVFLPLLVYILWRTKEKGLIRMTLAALPMIFATFYFQRVALGGWFNIPYHFQTSPFKFEAIPVNTFLTFIYYPADLALPELGSLKMPVLIGTFYFIMAPVGIYYLWKNKVRREVVLVLATTIVVTILYSSSYYQFHSGTFGQFPADFRYLLPAYPFLVMFSVVGLLSLLKMNRTSVNLDPASPDSKTSDLPDKSTRNGRSS